MKKILLVEASPNKEISFSRKAAREVIETLKRSGQPVEVIERDLSQIEIPHVSRDLLGAFANKGPIQDAGMQRLTELSDRFIEELVAADLLIVSAPMWNFGMPSSLKAWIDHVARSGKTFYYTEKGPVGLMTGKSAILVTSSGGIYSDGPGKPMNFLTPHLRAVLSFMGFETVQTVEVEGTSIPTMREKALEQAFELIRRLKF